MKTPVRTLSFRQLWQQEDINFLLTNRVPRIALTRAMGWFSGLRSRGLTRASIWVWRRFAELDLADAAQTDFESLHACFTRALRPGARPVAPDPGVLASPCDGIVGACGMVRDGQVFQAKGLAYPLAELFGGDAAARARAAHYRDGCYVTLRLTSGMYHRFHAPHDGRLQDATYISGDTWNVNPIALQRIERLFCRNERALLPLRLVGGHVVTMVPVAAILVASIRLHALDVLLHLRYRGPNPLPCDAGVCKGQELGWFQHGSTILVFAPRGFTLAPGVEAGTTIRMGQPLMRLPPGPQPAPGPTWAAHDIDTAMSRGAPSI